MQKIALVFAGVQALEQFKSTVSLTHPGVMAGGDVLGTQAHGMVQKCLELDLGIAQHIRVGRAPGLVLAQKLGEHPVFVFGGEVHMFDLDAQHVGDRGGIDKVDVGRTVRAVVVIFPVFHEDGDHLVALLLEQPRRDGRVDPAAQAHDHALGLDGRLQLANAAMPVWARPRIKAWMSWVPS